MKDSLKIRWTEEAAQNLEIIVHYLEANWSEKEIRQLFAKLEKQLELLSLFPHAYPVSSKRRKIRRCVFTKNLTIYYAIEDGFLILLSLFDSRQHPQKNKS
jgi:plasmid stabilization system protein ParE